MLFIPLFVLLSLGIWSISPEPRSGFRPLDEPCISEECPNPAVPNAEHAPWVGEAFVHVTEASHLGFMPNVYDGRGAAEDLTITAAETEQYQQAELPADQRPTGKKQQRGRWASSMRSLAFFGMVASMVFVLSRHISTFIWAWHSLAPVKVGVEQEDRQRI